MIKKTIYTISGMHCTSCSLDIDGALEDTDGVLKSNTNYAKSQTEVAFDEEKITNDGIAKLIETLGYRAKLN